MYLLDTNHCSLILLGDPNIIKQIEDIGEDQIATTIITAGELLYMAENSTHREQNLIRLKDFIVDIRIYYLDVDIANVYGSIKSALIKRFGPKQKTKRKTTKTTELGFDENDLWIAAIAIRHQLTLVSADTDFLRIQAVIDLSWENWRS